MALNVDKKRLFFSLLPFLVICGFYLIWRTHFMPSDKLKFQGIFSWQKLSTFFYLCQSYVSQLILPHGLAIRMLPQKLIFNLILIPLSFGYSLAAIALIISKNKAAAFGLVFYFLGLVPILNLIDHVYFLGKVLSEPYVYMASAGFFIIIAYLLLKLYVRFPKVAGFSIALIILFYSSLTVMNNINYKDEASFYNYLLGVDKKNTIAHLNLGNVYFKKKMFTQAEKEARIVLAIEPDAWDAYLLLGNIVREKGDLPGAAKLYNLALLLNPVSTEAINNLGLIYMAQGSADKAIETFKRAMAINPESVLAMQNLADILITKKLYNEALVLCDKILKLSPDDTGARIKIGIVLAESGHLQQAESVFKEALKLDPNSVEALRNLGVLYANSGDLNKAMSIWKKALNINPDDKETRENIERAKTIKESQRH
jgi:tetratricopeptide (TPR) repeat protein